MQSNDWRKRGFLLLAMGLLALSQSGCSDSLNATHDESEKDVYRASAVPLGLSTGKDAPTQSTYAVFATASFYERHGVRFKFMPGCRVEEETVPEINFTGIRVYRGNDELAQISVRNNDRKTPKQHRFEITCQIPVEFPEASIEPITRDFLGSPCEGIVFREYSRTGAVFTGEWFVAKSTEFDRTVRAGFWGDRNSTSRGSDAAVVLDSLQITGDAIEMGPPGKQSESSVITPVSATTSPP
ncbi:hypothetical protein [Lignipirellula cremea]|uniref:Lipoprotein n=1 Tax=Lignipirellula cremea TaxID=2528010 RepID=A0A518DZ32_9BACT|nr:hypothetical protein [Lignipirellula cremea]QDU97061.1 hypothetical protein Pla8534_48870 [Lignipirellula cremea]